MTIHILSGRNLTSVVLRYGPRHYSRAAGFAQSATARPLLLGQQVKPHPRGFTVYRAGWETFAQTQGVSASDANQIRMKKPPPEVGAGSY